MCIAIEFSKNDLTEAELQGLSVHGDDVRVSLTDSNPMLPIRAMGGNRLVEWGNRRRPKLPKTGYAKKESILQGRWSWLKPEPVDIIAYRGFAGGTWFQIQQGIKGILVKDPQGRECVYMLTEASTHYYKTMTRSGRMPVLLAQII